MSADHAATSIGTAVGPMHTRATQLRPTLARASALLAAFVTIHAVLQLVQSIFGVPARPSPTEQVPFGTQLTLLLVALALLLARRPRTRARKITARVLAASAALLATVSFLYDLYGSWVVDEPGRGSTSVLGWMAPNGALALLLLSAAVAQLDRPNRRSVWPHHEPLALAATLIAFVALLGYLYGVAELYWMERASAMSLPTSIALLLLGLAVLLSRLDRGLGGLLASGGLGGSAARRLLPAAVIIPTLLGLLLTLGERSQLYDTILGTALLTATTVVFFGAVTAWSASALARVDAERVRTLEALRDESIARETERRQLRTILDVLPLAVFIADPRGRFIDASREAAAVWGGPLPESLGGPEKSSVRGWNAVTGEPLKPSDWAIAKALSTGATYGPDEVDIEVCDGVRKTFLSYAAAIHDETGAVVGGVAVLVDITDRKRAERELAALKDQLEERVRERTAELVAANAELEAFSYSVSHDLRAPLRWIDGFTRALAEDHADELGPSGQEYLRQLHESVERMTQLIDALLWLSRVTMCPIDREQVDLGAIAREIAAELAEHEPERDVEWDIADGLIVSGDGRLLRILLDNLLRNAWKFTKDSPRAHIEVGATEVRGERVFFVCDDGVGFDQSYADRLFRPFERLHGQDEFEGTGIGLALVRRIVVRHGGRVWAESRPERGACFYFTLAPRRSSA